MNAIFFIESLPYPRFISISPISSRLLLVLFRRFPLVHRYVVLGNPFFVHPSNFRILTFKLLYVANNRSRMCDFFFRFDAKVFPKTLITTAFSLFSRNNGRTEVSL